MLLENGVKALLKVLKAYMGEATWLVEHIGGRMARPPRGGITTKNAFCCCNVAMAT